MLRITIEHDHNGNKSTTTHEVKALALVAATEDGNQICGAFGMFGLNERLCLTDGILKKLLPEITMDKGFEPQQRKRPSNEDIDALFEELLGGLK